MTRKRFRTISSSSQQATLSSQQATLSSQQATPSSQQPTPSSLQPTVPSFENDEPSNDDETLEALYNPRASIGGYSEVLVHQRFGRKMENYKCSLKHKFFNEAFTPQHVKNKAPTDVNLEQFCNLVDFWYSDAGRHRSEGKQSRSLHTSVHTAGSKSFARYAHELEKEKQVPIDRAELYKAVHSRFDGSPMNPDVAEKINQLQNQNVTNPNLDQVPPTFPISSHASRKTFHDGVDSAGADGADADHKRPVVAFQETLPQHFGSVAAVTNTANTRLFTSGRENCRYSLLRRTYSGGRDGPIVAVANLFGKERTDI
ncbi:hypothetical protein CJ030_MR4G026986 [Morella rubra]|uniref:Uncharacterized protein n=1 Tax=Morella rubra TaxID=262757 RepID=A0A6A1VQY5_9ROSI|nr:hypothetical protein CJ030_MR4G026986 [Morella rubra]